MKIKRGILLVLILVAAESFGFSQDLENISKKDLLKVSGGLGLQTTAYAAIGAQSNRDPFLGVVNLNLNFNILGIVSAPFSATFSTQSIGFSTPQPFNNFGISPKYKSVTAHLGYRSMNLSEFSLSGSQFLGVGVEVSPEDAFVKGKVLFGRFAKPVFFNPDGTIATDPSFSRIGWGTGITLGRSAKNQLTFNLFKAKDDPNSLDVPAEDLGITPADNLVLGLTGKKAITKKISVDGEFDLSFYTNDVTVPREILEGYSYFNNIPLFSQNTTSELRKAIVANANFSPSFAKFQLKYRRVDPGYKTLGIAFVNNDYEDLSLKSSFGLMEKRLGVSVSGGVQRNDLLKQKVTGMLRLISSLGLTYRINESWNASVNFANFTTDTKQTVVLTLDSLSMVQTTKNLGANLARSFGNEVSSGSFTVAFNYQDAIVDEVRTTTFYNTNVGYQRQHKATKTSFGAALMLTHSINESSTNSNLGPSIMFGRPLMKDKLQMNLMAAYLVAFVDGQSGGGITNLGMNGNYKLSEKHKIGFQASNLMKQTDTGNSTEITFSANYNYAF